MFNQPTTYSYTTVTLAYPMSFSTVGLPSVSKFWSESSITSTATATLRLVAGLNSYSKTQITVSAGSPVSIIAVGY